MPVRGYSKYQKTLSIFVDLIIINVSFGIGYFLRFDNLNQFNDDEIIILLVLNFSWWIITTQSAFPISHREIRFDRILLNFLKNILLHGIIIFTSIVVLKLYSLSRLMLVYSFIFQLGLIIIWRLSFAQLLILYRKSGRNFRSVAILGTGESALEIYNIIAKNKAYGYKFIGFFDDHPNEKISKCHHVFPLENFMPFARQENVDEVFCALPETYTKKIIELMEFSENNLIRFKIIPNFKKFIHKKVIIEFIQNVPLVLTRPEPLESLFSRTIKRAFDIVFSFLIIVCIFSWLFPILAILIKLESKGPVFFIQKRTGKENKEFKIYKFRSMRMNKDADTKQATKDDMRITFLGKFMRKYNIDELPQFFNVFLGHMSVVGPRPHMLKHTEQYAQIIDKYMVRHFVKPGITGWAQVNGRKEVEWNKRIALNVWYVDHTSFLLDLKIFFITILKVFINANNENNGETVTNNMEKKQETVEVEPELEH